MSKQSPAVARIVAVLNFFIEHPQQAFTLTQVVKSLHLSRATAHSILLGFVDSGYIYRRPDKSYVLGPALPALAATAHQHFSPLTVAGQEMRALADELDVVASALFQDGDEFVVRERAASVTHLGAPQLNAVRRFPIHPWGSIFLVPLSNAQIEEQLSRNLQLLGEDVRQQVSAEVEFARRNGFIAMLLGEGKDSELDLASRGRFAATLNDEDMYGLRYLVAPVLGGFGEVAFAISLFGFRRPLSGVEIMQTGQRLRETCDRIAHFMRGRPPEPTGELPLLLSASQQPGSSALL